MKMNSVWVFCKSVSILLLTLIQFSNSASLEKEVVVIGSGISGLAAAREILNRGQGKFSVRVFEARAERYGGRVYTGRLLYPQARGLELDVGGAALNILDHSINPLLNLTSNLGLETATLSNPVVLVPWQNKEYSGDELIQIMMKVGTILTEAINTTRTEKKDISVREAVNRQLREKAISEDSLPSLLLKTLPSYIMEDYSAHLYHQASVDFGYNQVLLDGMGELLDRLASGNEDEAPLKINLHTIVRQIYVDRAKGKVVLRLKDGSQVTADRVIVTVPASVIAQGKLMFDPPLPADYQKAVASMGMAQGNKLSVFFNASFWSDNHDVFISASETDVERGNLKTWLNLNRILGKPVLVGMLIGEGAKEMEALSKDQLEKLVREKLSQVFGEEKVAAVAIKDIVRSTWMTDEWSGFASTYPKVGNSRRLWETFAEPRCPYIFFAGEHTVFRGHGSLHGAYTSGIRAANQLLSEYCEERAREEKRKLQEMREAEQKKDAKKDDDKKDEKPEEDNAKSEGSGGEKKDEL